MSHVLSLEEMSPAEQLASLPEDEREAVLSQLSLDDVYALRHDFFGWWARPKQRLPESCSGAPPVEGAPPCQCGGEYSTLVILCGRGWGKTRFDSELAHELAWKYPGCRMAIVTPVQGEGRKIAVDGESGLTATERPWNRVRFWPGKGNTLEWDNGSHGVLLSADEPNRARGYNYHFVICDEFAAWARATSDDITTPGWSMLSNLKLGLRLPAKPNWPAYRPLLVITTTPRPTDSVKKLVGVGGFPVNPKTHVVYGSTYENRSNLDADYFDSVISDVEGTRLGEQELDGRILIDNPGALFKHNFIQYVTEDLVPETLKSIVVAVDPSVGGTDETGIIVAGVGPEPGTISIDVKADEHPSLRRARIRQRKLNGYVLADLSMTGSPDAWARKVVNAFHDYKANYVVAESNNGGDLVSHTLKTVDPNVPVKLVHASRGKQTRAEPVAAIYEQLRVWHVGRLSKLEDQMTSWDPNLSRKSPDRMDALVWAMHNLMGKGKIHAFSPPILIPKADLISYGAEEEE